MGKGRSLRHYEDFQVGVRYECAGPRVVTSAERALWIHHTGDPTGRFADGSKLAHPLMVMAIGHGQVMREVGAAVREALGVANLIVHRPVAVGSVLRTTARILGIREDPDRSSGVIWIRVAIRDARGVVMSYATWLRIDKRHKQSKSRRDALPNLVDAISLGEIPIRELTPSPRHETGGRFSLADYAEHETLHHSHYQCVWPGDIPSFARTYRQADPRHHDPEHPRFCAPLPMVVGWAYAAAHDGLEQRLGLGGVNAMRLPNPVKTGMRLYAMSQVVATEALTRELGAIRLRTFLFADHDPTEDSVPRITEGRRYEPHVALDMDYWEIVPV